MTNFAEYESLNQIHEGDNSRVFRARRIHDGLPVILKFLKAEYPNPDQIRRYRQEYQLTQKLQSPTVIKAYGMEEWQRTLVIIFEDFGGDALKQLLLEYPQGLPIQMFLFLAIKIADALGQLHSQGIIHKDLNPANIVFNPETISLKLIDLGISTQLSRENPSLTPPSSLEGTLLYLSPEQTGRMNRVLDYRTDFYSLGITFYELLTGRLPFTSDDPMELVHCHIAKQPISLMDVRGGQIPPILAEIVSKLMAKNAEDRYQSSWGLMSDLEACSIQWEQTGTIAMFPLGGNDVSDRFQIPQKLYGREREIAQLLAAFERISGNHQASESSAAEIVLVTGYSGIGKSALVRSLYKPITARRGYFIAGKFDQFQRNIPYSALVEAFSSLVRQLLGEPEALLQQWRSRLLEALGENGQVAIDVIPDLELIVGTQPPLLELGASESQNRFNLVFQKFIQAFCHPEHPLVMFLDDMQWADLATLNLLERLMGENQIEHLLLLVAFRDYEVSVGHSLSLAITQIQHKGVKIEQITLAPLSLQQIGQLMAETMHQEIATVMGLAELTMHKTEGNPFFANQFLKTLHNENLLTFNYSLRQWQWDLEQIERMGFTDNVVELMVGQLQNLPTSVRDILSTAAYLGTEFDLKTLSSVKNQTPEAIFADLKLAIERGFVVTRSHLDQNLLIQEYQFAHDRIQQAAYTLIPNDQQAATHLNIGRILLARNSALDFDEKLFDIVNHLNRGVELIENAEKQELASLNLQAGRKAIKAGAHRVAIAYLDQGISLLNRHGWNHHYKIMLALHNEAVRAAFLSADLKTMEHLITAVMQNTNAALDRVNVNLIKIEAYGIQGRPLEALATGLDFLTQLGITFPPQPSETDFVIALTKTQELLAGRHSSELGNLPPMTDPIALAALSILVKLTPVSFISAPQFHGLLVLQQLILSINHGNAPASAVCYVTYGTFLCHIFKDYKGAYAYGQIALKILSQSGSREFQATVLMIVHSFISHWTIHLRDTLEPLHQAYILGIETGEFAYVGYALFDYCTHAYLMGKELSELYQTMQHYGDVIEQIGQHSALSYLKPYQQAVLNLIGQSEHPSQLVGIIMDEVEICARFEEQDELAGFWHFYTCKLPLCYLFGKLELGLKVSAAGKHFAASGVNGVAIPILCFYDSLCRLAMCAPHLTADCLILLKQVAENQQEMETWSKSAPMNYLHKWQLVEAERQRILGDNLAAIHLYDLAIAGAKANQYIQEEALANELAAKFYLNWGKETIARAYMMEARYCYLRWGAIAKVRQLETEYPQLLAGGLSSRLPTRNSLGTHTQNISAALDLATVMKSSQAIAGEILLENLLQTLMKILLENAGAQMGCLLLPTSTASSGLENFSIAIHSNPDSAQQILPESVLHYVARTQASVVLDDAFNVGNFIHDPYIQSVKPLSIMCYPLLNQNELIGMVYLENKVTTGAFSSDRIELLQLLSGQAAISISNAQLYAKVRNSEQQLQQFLEAVPVGIGVLDSNGDPYYVNRRAKELLGKGIAPESTGEEIAQVYQIHIAETDRLYPNEQLPIVRALKGEASSVDDVEVHQGDRIVPIEAWGTPIYNEAGNVQYAITAFQDITQRKQAEKILTDYNRTLEQQVTERTAELQRVNRELTRLATLDGLTKIANRRRFDDYLAMEWHRHIREQQSLGLILIDIDYFKRYNDQYGHQGGDECLIRVAQTIARVPQRPIDLVARYGGEEFVVILPNTDLKGALFVAEEMRQAISSLAIPHAQSDVNPYVTLSLGVAVLIPTTDTNPETLIANADQALYKAKHLGRDRAVAHIETI